MKFNELFLTTFSFVLIGIVAFSSCKKDALKITTEKTYSQPSVEAAHDLYGGAMSLTLKPGGMASINPGGDIVYSGNYDISGHKITVKVEQTQSKYIFTIISDEEIHGENGEILMLVKN